MRRYLNFVTPQTRRHILTGMCVTLILIVLMNILFHWVLIQTGWPFGMIVLHALFAGGPFVIGFFVITDHQLGILRDLSLRSRKDGLTGLNNRRTFLELASRRLSAQQRGVLLLLDADHFKDVNDTYGHAVGDMCLEAIARHLKWNLRPDDVAGRIGGEEFAVLIAGVTLAQGRAIGERMVRPIPFSGGAEHPYLSITLSVGAAAVSPDVSLDRLLIRADEALYAAKQAGRARMMAWDEDEMAA
ncbi:GGDEF domain-containing protein [Yoonia sp. 208BN28-4]|uniref:GGDEF domain-containing protein n=1 Tax=Yoonia sp. 208BN28-4 TaxID=3126505 RepID=UPI0030A2CF5A